MSLLSAKSPRPVTPAQRDKQRQYYAENKELVKQRNRERRAAGLDKKNPEVERRSSIKRRYGLEWDDFVALYNDAGGKCQICSKPLALFSVRGDGQESASVDHCHRTQRVRGVLCRHCNVGIGFLKEHPEKLINAAEYLAKHHADS